MSAKAAISGLVAIAGVAAVVLWLRPRDEEPAVPVPAAAPAPVEQKPPVVEVKYEAPPLVREPSPEERRRMFKLPTGDYVPSLNGVLDAPVMDWPRHIPYAPIVGKERDSHGNEWYVHADGSRSTNSMVFRSDLGRMDPSTQVANPTAALPMEAGTGDTPPGAPPGGRGGASAPGGAGEAIRK